MRISDWSSVVCSSDLPQRESAPTLLLSPGRVLGPSLCGVGLTDCVDDLLNELIGCGIMSRSAGDILTRSDVASLTANQSCYLLFERLLARRVRRPFEEVSNLCNCSCRVLIDTRLCCNIADRAFR